ncbi:hypothetical protein ACLMJK_000493 [Lecanora helva]
MDHRQREENHAIQGFLGWVHQVRRQEQVDTIIPRDTRYFVPHAELKAFLGFGQRLQELLEDLYADFDPIERPSTRDIKENYLRVFSILLCIGYGRFIKFFLQYDSLQDQKLPFLERPSHFPLSTSLDLFALFRGKQWEFCVPHFRFDMHSHLDRECILPIVQNERLGAGGSSVISKVVLFPEYNELESLSETNEDFNLKNDTYVLKSYRTRNAKEYYTAEKKAIMRLRNGAKPPENIVEYYGSFIQDGKYYALLEYMDRGTLESFMEDIQPPSSSIDAVNFWESLLGLSRGLALLHGLPLEDQSEGENRSFHGWHQDIKPSNILIRTRVGHSIYDSAFKLADLGLSHFKSTTSPDTTDMDSYGTRAYGAPETFRFDDSMIQMRIDVNKNVDVWSFGCVLSEVVTWQVLGKDGLQEYRRLRREEFQSKIGTGAGEAFHDGSRVLTTVIDNHTRLRQSDAITHGLASELLDLIDDMLVESQGRLSSKDVYQRCMRTLQRAKDKLVEAQKQIPTSRLDPASGNVPNDDPMELDSQHDHSVNGPKPPATEERPGQLNLHQDWAQQASPSANQPQIKPPELSVNAGLDWKSTRKSGDRQNLSHGELLTELEGRDHVFLIDNSQSMGAHMGRVKEVIELLAYILKDCGRDGINVYLTSQRSKLTTAAKTKDILRCLDSTLFIGRCNMEERLGSILEEYLTKLDRRVFSRFPWKSSSNVAALQRLSLYVLTDGVWQPKNEPAQAFIPLLKYMQQQDLPRNHVGLQFIRFGKDMEGARQIERLDNVLSAMDLDIVDIESESGNVWKMLLGAINHWFDDEDDNEDDKSSSYMHDNAKDGFGMKASSLGASTKQTQMSAPSIPSPSTSLSPPNLSASLQHPYNSRISHSRYSTPSSYSDSTAASSPPSLQEYPTPSVSYQPIEVDYTGPISAVKQNSARTKHPFAGYSCLYPGCTHVASRAFNLERHMSKHYPIPTEEKYDCPGRGCGRTGAHGFIRKDHMIEHLRNYHMQDIPKGKKSK